MDYRELLCGIEYTLVKEGPIAEIANVRSNSKNVNKYDAFIAIVGLKQDGHNYIQEAVNRGAALIICNRDRCEDISTLVCDATLVCVKDTREIFSRIANNFHSDPSSEFKLVGVTGTNGKTSTTTMLNHIFRRLGKSTGLIGTINIRINDEVVDIERTTPTTPDCLELGQIMDLCRAADAEYVFMEVSSMAMKLGRVRECKFDTVVFTNLSPEHLDDHKTMEDYKNSKLMLFDLARYAVVNMDDPYGLEFAQRAAGECIKFGIEKKNECDLFASDLRFFSDRVEFCVNWKGTVTPVKVMIPSRFAVYNALAAIGAAITFGVEPRDIGDIIGERIDIAGRYEVIKSEEKTVIVDFAHTGVALENLLSAVRQNKTYRKLISVFGCGGDRDNSKRAVMGGISQRLADFTIVTSDNPRTEDPLRIIGHILEGMDREKDNYAVEPDREKAIKMAIDLAGAGDVVVISGKGHETIQIFNGYTIEFNDKTVAQKYLGK